MCAEPALLFMVAVASSEGTAGLAVLRHHRSLSWNHFLGLVPGWGRPLCFGQGGSMNSAARLPPKFDGTSNACGKVIGQCRSWLSPSTMFSMVPYLFYGVGCVPRLDVWMSRFRDSLGLDRNGLPVV